MGRPPILRGWGGTQPLSPGSPPTTIAGATGKAADPQFPDNTLIFDPGIGASAGNVLKTWAEVMALVLASPGITEIVFIGACSIPSGGPYDVSRTIWSGAGTVTGAGAPVSVVTIADGATFTGQPLRFRNALEVVNDGSASPFGAAGALGFYILDQLSVLKANAGKAALYAATSGGALFGFVGGWSTIGDATNAAISADASSSVQLIPIGGVATVKANSISGPAGATLNIDGNWPELVLGDLSSSFLGTTNITGGGEGAGRVSLDSSGFTGFLSGLSPETVARAMAILDTHVHTHASTTGQTTDDHHAKLHAIGDTAHHSASALVAWDALLTGDSFEVISRKAAANGYASLDSGGQVPVAQIPNAAGDVTGAYSALTVGKIQGIAHASGAPTDGQIWFAASGAFQKGAHQNISGAGSNTHAAIDTFIANHLSGRFTTAGGSTTEDVTLTGVTAGDVIVATVNVEGATPRKILSAEYQAADTVRVTWDGDPSTDHEFSLIAIVI